MAKKEAYRQTKSGEPIGEELVAKLAALDHRHFATMRPRHVKALELLPA